MLRQEALEEYLAALRLGQREYKDLHAAKKDPHPQILDEILPANTGDVIVRVGLKDIPIDQIVGTKSAGRITAFTKTFLPLLAPETEFAYKWMNLCSAHLSDEGRHYLLARRRSCISGAVATLSAKRTKGNLALLAASVENNSKTLKLTENFGCGRA